MSTAYLPPMNYGGARPGDSLLMEAVLEGPAYARSRAASRWHIVRSAVDRLDPWGDEVRRTFQYWCGTFVSGRRVLTVDTPPTGEPVCGTCHGRREGADPDRRDLLFTPRVKPPTTCPGSRRLWVDDPTGRASTCLVCGDVVRMRAHGGPYSSAWGAQRHAPGPGLIDGCEFHGWHELTPATTTDGRTVITCRCKTVETR